MKGLLAVVLITLIQGCTTTTTASDAFLADGSKGYHIRCGTTISPNYGDCVAKAGEVCGTSGYTIVMRESDNIFIRCNAARQ
jgi:hypothetical protein